MTSNTFTHRLARRIALACLAVVIFVTAATAGATPTAAPPVDPDFAAIDAYVETQMRDLRSPGMALGIVQGDRIVHLKGFGVAVSSGHAVTPQHSAYI